MGLDAAPGQVTVVARGSNAASALARDLAQAALRVDPDLFIVDVKTMKQHLSYILFLPQMAALSVSGFAALALVLAAVGLFGMVSYGVSRRTKELGIRISLGADGGRITKLVMQGAIRAVVIGGVIGLLGALATSRLVGRFLVGVPWLDPPTFVLVPLLLGGIAVLAAYIPARRANQIDPIGALRSD